MNIEVMTSKSAYSFTALKASNVLIAAFMGAGLLAGISCTDPDSQQEKSGTNMSSSTSNSALLISEQKQTEGRNAAEEAGFSDYWYAGVAELNVFDLQQARYGELRKGDAVMIFVTEDFSRKGLVKLDNPGANKEDAVKVMKCNFTRNFQTGIYVYSTMQSIFTPVDGTQDPATLKVSTSSQELCGHVFMELDRDKKGYSAQVNSYFEGESARDVPLGNAFAEDGLWNLIRLNPDALPVGKFQAIPSNLDTRLRHVPLSAASAEASLSKAEDGEMVYEIQYPERGRSLKVYFDAQMPRAINRWEETVNSRGQVMTTTGVRRKQIQLDYWSYNQTKDEGMRMELGLH